MSKEQQIRPGTIVRADFFWKDSPKADGKARNCVVLGINGRRAVIAPITSVDQSGDAGAVRLDDRLKRNIAQLGDDKASFIVLREQNIVYIDGPRLYPNNKAPEGADRRIFGQLPDGVADGLRKFAISMAIKPGKKQVERDWKEDLIAIRGRDAAASLASTARSTDRSRSEATPGSTLEDRVKAAARDLHTRKEGEKPQRKTLTLGGKKDKLTLGG